MLSDYWFWLAIVGWGGFAYSIGRVIMDRAAAWESYRWKNQGDDE